MQRGSLVEDGLRIANFQLTQDQGEMHDLFVARFLDAGESLQLETTQALVETEVSLTDAKHAIVLCGTSVGAKIDHVGDAGLLHSDTIGLVAVSQVEGQVGGGIEIVLPAEMVGVVAFLEPIGTLPFEFHVEGSLTVILGAGSDKLFPLAFDVEVTDLVAQSNQLCLPRDACRLE